MKNPTHKYVIERFAHFGIEFLGKVKLGRRIGLRFRFPKRVGIIVVENFRKYLRFLRTDISVCDLEDDFYDCFRDWKDNHVALAVRCYCIWPQPLLRCEIDITLEYNGKAIRSETSHKIYPTSLHIEQTCFAFCQGKVPGPILLDFLRDQSEIREAGCHF